jgi:Tol biopolymer transport system component/DNA-binding winged helix-turn-helix (wHTH) protein
VKKNKRFYEFGEFRIDTVNRRLMRGEEPIALKSKAVETLLVLLEQKGDVVEKDDLMDRLWADSFVEESNLTQNIYSLRKALGDSHLIETIPRRGYRFTAEVREWEDAADDDEVLLIREKTNVSISYANGSDGADEKAETRDTAIKLIGGPKKQSWFRLGFLTGAVLMAALAAWWLWPSKIPFENAKLSKLTTTGNVWKAAASPDGRYLAFVTNDGNQQALWLRQIATEKDLQLTAPAKAEFYGLTFSRDGEYLYFVNQEMNKVGVLFRVPILGGTPSKLAEDVDSPVTIAPDDKRIAFIRMSSEDRAIVVAGADGTEQRKLAVSTRADANALAPEWQVPPAWSPDGKTIACGVGVAGPGSKYETIWGFDTETGTSRQLTSQRWEAVGRAEWLPNGKGLMVTAAEPGTGFVQQIWHIASSGAARKVTNDLSDYRDLGLASDGKNLVAVQAERKANISVAAANDLDHPRQVTTANYDGLNGLAWTPDGRIVYTRRVTDGQNLWISDDGGSEPRVIKSGAGYIIQPEVSPDGRYIVYAANRDGNSHIWRIDIDGRNALELTHGSEDVQPQISADGQTVVYKGRMSGKGGIFRVPIDGGEPVRFTEKMSSEPAISPDGQTIAFVYREAPAAPNQLAVMPTGGGEPKVICELPAYYGLLTWMPDSRALAYAEKQKPEGNIWIQSIDGNPPKQLTYWTPGPIFSFAWSRDGNKIAFAGGTQTSDIVLITNK